MVTCYLLYSVKSLLSLAVQYISENTGRHRIILSMTVVLAHIMCPRLHYDSGDDEVFFIKNYLGGSALHTRELRIPCTITVPTRSHHAACCTLQVSSKAAQLVVAQALDAFAFPCDPSSRDLGIFELTPARRVCY